MIYLLYIQYEYKDNYFRHKFKRLTNLLRTVVSAGQGHASRCLARVEDSHLPAALSGKGGSSAELIPWYWLRFLFREPQQVNTTKIEKNKLGNEFFKKTREWNFVPTKRSLSLAANMTLSTFSVVRFMISIRENGVDGKEAGESAASTFCATYIHTSVCREIIWCC